MCDFAEEAFNHGRKELPSKSSLPLCLPELDGGLTLVEMIGQGAYGKVYLGRTPNGAFRAVKGIQLSTSEFQASNNKPSEAPNEAKMLSDLKNSHVIKLYESKTIQGILWLSMEYAPLGNASEFLARQNRSRMTDEELSSVAFGVLHALKVIHKQGIIHRDVKPTNILITKSGKAKLSDWGTACFVNDPQKPSNNKKSTNSIAPTSICSSSSCNNKSRSSSSSNSNCQNDHNSNNGNSNSSSSTDCNHCNLRRQSVQGTIQYLAPEIFDSEEFAGYNEKIDVWALGMTLLELAQGFNPFQAEHVARVLFHLVEASTSPSLAEPHTHSHLFNDFLAECLVIDPKTRPTAAKLLKHPFVKKASKHMVTATTISKYLQKSNSSPQLLRAGDSPRTADSQFPISGSPQKGCKCGYCVPQLPLLCDTRVC